MPQTALPELTGRTAGVTGATQGIGRAIALALGGAGADVVVHGRRHEPAESLAKELGALGREAHVLLGDLADPATHQLLVESAWSWRGAVDIWVNNAGADTLTGQMAQASFDDKLQRLWQVDVVATINLSRAVGRRMVERGEGSIINVGWDQAETGFAGDSGELFAATKGAIMCFTRSLARSLAPAVRVNCVAPGWIKTKWGEQAPQHWQDNARRQSLMARWGAPEDVAGAVRFLASPAAAFLTGCTLPVNGGLRQN